MGTAPLILGHRGAPRAAPENTVAAFRRARELGADGVELDVRRTADGALVLHHDAVIEGFGLVAASTFPALRSSHPSIPTLAEALDATHGLLVNVEVKCLPWEEDADPEHEVVAAVVDLVLDTGAKVVISSFDLGAVDACRTRAPQLETGWLTHSQDVTVVAPIAADHGHMWLHPDRASVLRAPGPALASCHDRGLRVDVWTVDDPDEMRLLAQAGVDAIITNVPDVARTTLDDFAGDDR
jgi:glycerophosphoryl diester phosphodiesterase